MAKQRKKRKVKNPAPPLSKLDKFIYHLIIFLSVVLLLAIFILFFYLNRKITFSDEDVVLYAERWTLFFLLPPLLIFAISIVGFFSEGLTDKKPIFGNKNIDYRSTTKYSGVQFLFEKKKHKKKLNEREKKFQIISRTVLSVLCILSLLFGIGGIFGRKCLLNNGNVQVYSIVNTVKNEYSLGDYSKITIEYGRESVGKYDWRPACYFNIETDNGKEFLFCMNDSRYSVSDIDKNLENILNIKESYENQGIDVSIDGVEYIDELIEYYEMNESEIETLYKLFEIE